MGEFRRPSAGLGCAVLVLIFFGAVAAYGLAYQAKPGYFIQVGARIDRPYLVESSWNTREPAEKDRTPDSFDYRFTRDKSRINLPGLGSQPLTITLRVNSSENPNPGLKISINDNLIPSEQTQPPPQNQWKEISFAVPAGFFKDGNLQMQLETNTWRPKGDSRDLGLLVDWIKIDPANQNFLNPGVRPPDETFLPLLLVTVLLGLTLLTLGVPPLFIIPLVATSIAGLTFWLITDRLSLTTLVAQDLLRPLFFLWLGVFLLVELVPLLSRRLGVPLNRVESGWLAGFFLLGCVLLMGGQLHPQFTSSDIGLNVRVMIAQVTKGILVHPEPLPNNQLAPYPPAYYILLLPFTNFLDGSRLSYEGLFKVASSVMQASGVYFVFYLAGLVRIYFPGRDRPEEAEPVTNWAGLIAAGFYAINKYIFLVFSQGNHANLFGEWAFLLFLCVIAGTLVYRHSPWKITVKNKGYQNKAYPEEKPAENLVARYVSEIRERWRHSPGWQKALDRITTALRYVLPLLATFLVFLSHYGTFLMANAFMVVLLLVLVVGGGRPGRRDARYLAIIYVIALVAAFALYYYNFTGLISDQLSRSLGGTATTGLKPKPPFELLPSLSRIYNDLRDYFGYPVLLAALGGIGLWVAGYIEHRRVAPDKTFSPLGLLLFALGLTTAGFTLLERIQGIESRYQLYMLPLLAVLAGTLLVRVWRSGWLGIVLVSSIFLFQLLDSLSFWLERLTYYFY